MQTLISAQCDLTDAADYVLYEFNTKPSYDYVISCFEPIGAVHGGIGSYTRMLLENAHKSNVLLVTATAEVEFQSSFVVLFPNISIVVLKRNAERSRDSINFIGDSYNKFSFNLMRYLLLLRDRGVEFCAVEVPDYGAEGYFLIRAKKARMLRVEIYIRLHSPNFMLFFDNKNTVADYQDHFIEMAAYELCALRDADHILVGTRAMLDHVLTIAEREFSFPVDGSKAIFVPHPWPKFDSDGGNPIIMDLAQFAAAFSSDKAHIGLIGRMEPRKGSVRFAKNLATAVLTGKLQRDALRIHFFGADTSFPGVPSIREVINDVLTGAGVDVRFWGRLDQDSLHDITAACDALIFPSLFENYPNALLEVLATPNPKLVSCFGGMAEIVKEFPNVQIYDPSDEQALANFVTMVIGLPRARVHHRLGRDNYAQQSAAATHFKKIAFRHNKALVDFISSHRSDVENEIGTLRANSFCVIIPHFRGLEHISECLNSVESQLRDGDEVIVVDDASGENVTKELKELIEQSSSLFDGRNATLRLILREKNGGPGSARNDGAAASDAPYLVFLDCDDILAPGALDALGSYLDNNQDVDATAGIMKTFGAETHYWVPKDGIRDVILKKNVSHCGIAIRRDVFTRVRYSDDLIPHYEDWEFMMRLIFSGRRFEIIPQVTYFYRVISHKASRNRSRQEFEAYSRSKIILSSLTYALECGTPPSARFFSQLMVDWLNLAEHIKDPDVFAKPVESSLIARPGIVGGLEPPEKFSNPFSIDIASIDGGVLGIVGWLAVESGNVSFKISSPKGQQEIKHEEVVRGDVVEYFNNKEIKLSAFGFKLEIPLRDFRVLGRDAEIIVRVADQFRSLGRASYLTAHAVIGGAGNDKISKEANRLHRRGTSSGNIRGISWKRFLRR